MQNWFKSFFDPSKGHRNFTAYSETHRRPGQFSSNAIKFNPNNTMLINSAQIGKTSCMSEIVSVTLEDQTQCKIKVFYDSQSQHT